VLQCVALVHDKEPMSVRIANRRPHALEQKHHPSLLVLVILGLSRIETQTPTRLEGIAHQSVAIQLRSRAMLDAHVNVLTSLKYRLGKMPVLKELTAHRGEVPVKVAGIKRYHPSSSRGVLLHLRGAFWAGGVSSAGL
jgi:hypothetical protein